MSDRLALCYHAVSDSWPNPYALPTRTLEAQLRHMLGRGYEAVRFTDAVAGAPARKALAVTFDDAHRSVYELGFPMLARLGIVATVFVPTGPVSEGRPLLFEGYERWRGGDWERELEPMSWSQLGELAGAGWEIGSHSRSHPRLTRLDGATLDDELRASKAEVERRTGRACTSIAYPYGDFDDRVTSAARAAGYRAGAAIGNRRPHALAWPRHQVLLDEPESYFSREVSPLMRRARRSRVWPLASAAARAARAGRRAVARSR
jgi:peptidoglycan/xylan/chitin deacetylase (PgdA/CDA1 family)